MKTIVVLGMHRSATSLISKGLNYSGVYIGDDLLPESGCNPWGHYEDREFVHLNDRILAEAGGTWKDPPPETSILMQADKFELRIKSLIKDRESMVDKSYPLWGWKDPRTTLTIRLYYPYLTNPHFVACFREPKEVASSLMVRDGMNIAKGMLLAKEYNSRLLMFISSIYSLNGREQYDKGYLDGFKAGGGSIVMK